MGIKIYREKRIQIQRELLMNNDVEKVHGLAFVGNPSPLPPRLWPLRDLVHG